MYNYLLINKGAQNQIDVHQQLIDINNIDEIQVLDLNTINMINQATELNDITNGETQINSHLNHQVCCFYHISICH